ncbi:hypothetical protein EV586_101328 [Tumebacillus sp. BK434]|uniref:hypothetical protein n=1 Tax=Tumebacillus sp. BK434 TaxID=2512169 RepID=UPI001043E685|nr:hypothetical protein [Tumebacillus sp. BK434]TCP59112.1 hypothetical protein EV586_101328 [Tumebacillus sp. BK434]
MTLGHEMKKIYLAMEQICLETADLITVVNDQFQNGGFEAPRGTSVMYDTSTSYHAPKKWLPYFQQRVFSKQGATKQRGIGINILFHWEAYGNQVPVISCGLLLARNERGVVNSDEFFMAGWEHSARDAQHPVFYVMNCSDDNYFQKIINYFIPLDRITDEAAVRQLILDPLLALYDDKFDTAADLIAGEAKTIEELRATPIFSAP